jgi:hypothetical protein
LVVQGVVKRSHIQPTSPIGHLDNSVYDTSGRLLAEKSTFHHPKIITANTNRKDGAQFSAEFPVKSAQPLSVKIAFHKNEMEISEIAPHSHEAISK